MKIATIHDIDDIFVYILHRIDYSVFTHEEQIIREFLTYGRMLVNYLEDNQLISASLDGKITLTSWGKEFLNAKKSAF